MKRLNTLILVFVAGIFLISAAPFSSENHSESDRLSKAELALDAEFEIPAQIITAFEEAGICDYKAIIRAIPGFKACLRAAQEPGYELVVTSVANTGPCLGGPIGDITFYFIKDYICPPPCLGPPDILVAEVYICACSVVNWTCY